MPLKRIQDLVNALRVFQRYGQVLDVNTTSGLRVMLDPTTVSPDDRDILMSLGFVASGNESTRYFINRSI